ncbi:MAG: hypothetical protein D6701_13340 [Gemmatimonadetes bacterium]|nr:MAG: hypothetical protein D6701_13340 [Gemmatimonadota bacterium]
MRIRDASTLTLALAFALWGAACTSSDEGGEAEAPAEAPAAEAAGPEMPAELTGEGVWAFLTEHQYESWATWPGKGERYEGGAPHGALLTTYLNEVAAEALANHAGAMPVGAIVVKNNYMPDGTLAAVTAMVKTEDFNPEHNNWWFMKRNADGSFDAQGRFAGCEGCHGAMKDNDYIMTGSLSAAAEGEGQ